MKARQAKKYYKIFSRVVKYGVKHVGEPIYNSPSILSREVKGFDLLHHLHKDRLRRIVMRWSKEMKCDLFMMPDINAFLGL